MFCGVAKSVSVPAKHEKVGTPQGFAHTTHCKYIALCGTGCMASAYKKYGDINAAPAECTYYQEYLKEQYE